MLVCSYLNSQKIVIIDNKGRISEFRSISVELLEYENLIYIYPFINKMLSNLKKIQRLLIICALTLVSVSNAQEIRVVDKKGTIKTVKNNIVYTATPPSTNILENDIWFDNSDPDNIITKIYDGATWKSVSTGTAWNTTGNTGTSSATNFLGTTDAMPLVIKTANIEAARFTNETSGINSRFLLNPTNSWSFSSLGSSNLIGINTTTNNQRLRLTSGSSDTQDDSQGASIDLFGNATTTNAGRLDLVGGASASGTSNAITFWGNDGATNNPTQAERMVINGQGNVGIGNTTPNTNAILDLTNTNQRALLLPTETLPTNISTPTDGMLVYGSTNKNAYLRADGNWKPLLAYNSVSNELFFDGEDEGSTTYDDFYYVSFVSNDSWKVIRYSKTDVNDEKEASGSGAANQPITIAAVTALAYN
ncbi:MAG: hypothetical protein ABF260_01385 [Flavobacteriaceae bacterium]